MVKLHNKIWLNRKRLQGSLIWMKNEGKILFWRRFVCVPKFKNKFLLFFITLIGISTFLYFDNLSPLTSNNSISKTPCTKSDLFLSPVPLFYDDFGAKQEFKMEFANFNLTYSIQRPNKDVCARNISTLIIIISKPDNIYARQQIRETWMYDKANPSNVHSLFIIGSHKTKGLDYRIKQEQNQFGDIVRYESEDKYELLHVKTHAAFNWQQAFCPNVKYLLKTDDDTVVQLERLDHFMRTEFEEIRSKHPMSFFCNRWSMFKPHRNEKSRYYVSFEEFSGKYYPTFCQGCSYMGTSLAISSILNHTKNVNVLHLEDVLFTGVVAKKTSGIHHHAAGTFGARQNKPCDKEGIPYLSAYVGVPKWKLEADYLKLKNLNCISIKKDKPKT